MKLKHLLLCPLPFALSLMFSSCDGSDTIAENSLLNNLDAVGTSIDATINDDRIDITTIENIAGFTTALNFIFTGVNGAENGTGSSQTFEYVKTGEFLFELRSENDSQERLTRSLSVTLGSPSPIGTRFRELILRQEANFTAAEILEIINILNPSGASLVTSPGDPLTIQSSRNIRYNFRVTSNNRDKLAGVMRGLFETNLTALRVAFRAPTSAELANFRLLTPDHKIPFVTTTNSEITRASAGTWVLTLANREGTASQ